MIEKDKQMSKDELESGEEDVQKLVNKFNGIIDSICEAKEKEVMEV